VVREARSLPWDACVFLQLPQGALDAPRVRPAILQPGFQTPMRPAFGLKIEASFSPLWQQVHLIDAPQVRRVL
jgi:hypothetical protein